MNQRSERQTTTVRRLESILIEIGFFFNLLIKCVEGNPFGVQVIGGKQIPGSNLIGAFITRIQPGGVVDTIGEMREGKPDSDSYTISYLKTCEFYVIFDDTNEGDQVMEWNGVLLTGRLDEEVQRIIAESANLDEVEVIIRNGNCPFTNEFTGGIQHHHPSFLESTATSAASQAPTLAMNATSYGSDGVASRSECLPMAANVYSDQFHKRPVSNIMQATAYNSPMSMDSAGKASNDTMATSLA